ncbi:MAG TPA: hypothetical protein VEU73_13965 [Gemmatimonadales bacterium]|nr:hypothetical protein [Gemmatimonadales bacterium]
MTGRYTPTPTPAPTLQARSTRFYNGYYHSHGDSGVEAQHSSLAFYYWRLSAGKGDGDLSRHTIVNEVVVPIFNDAAVRAVADCIYARKYSSNAPRLSSTILLEKCDEVRLFMASGPQQRPRITALVARHVAARFPAARPVDYPAKERAGQADCAWYRRCLTQVTTIALDLHKAPEFAEHQRFIRTLDATPGLRAFTRAAMHDHLLRGSRTYAELGDDKWDRFWHEFHRWGPAPNLYPPGHLLENLLLVD